MADGAEADRVPVRQQGMLDTLRPITAGAYSAERNDIAKLDLALHPTAQRYEYGTQNDALFFALGSAIDFVQTIGMPGSGSTIMRWLRSSTGAFRRSPVSRFFRRRRKPTGRR